MDYKNLTSPCGLDCWNCIMYLVKDDKSKREKIAKKMNVPEDKASCQGCRNEKGIIGFLGMTEPCKVFKCVSEKRIDFCCDCEDFPCDNLHPYAQYANQRPHNTKVFNLCLIKKMGLEDWVENKAKSVRKKYFRGNLEL